MNRVAIGMLFFSVFAIAQNNDTVVRGLAVYAGSDESAFPAIVRKKVDETGKPVGKSDKITIQFDVLAQEPPALKIRFFHCNRDWTIDENLFVNDKTHNTSFYLNYEVSPGGVQGYRYRYINSFPDADDAVRFDYSGNWVFTVMDKNETQILAEERFFVVDQITPLNVSVTNDYLTANPSPYNQIHKVVARVKLPDEIDGIYFTTMDVYQNKKLYNPIRVDMWDKDPYTFVKGQGTGERIFSVANIMPGNDYRVLDFSNANRYPNRSLVKSIDGPDLMRLFWRTGDDHQGNAVLNKFSGINSDYLDVVFRLDMTTTDYRMATSGGKEIFLVGQFNFWNPTESDRLVFDANERAYCVTKLLRRGIYDYQYVVGTWDARNRKVVNQDWIGIEGNDWRTTNRYTIVVYYNDQRFGGFDRIVGYEVSRKR